MFADRRVDAVADALGRLLPGAHVEVTHKNAIPDGPVVYEFLQGDSRIRIVSGNPVYELWVEIPRMGAYNFLVSRPDFPFSKVERRFLGSVPRALGGLLMMPSDKAALLSQRVVSEIGLEHIWVAQVLRWEKSATFWTPLFILRLLMDLTFRRYEGAAATSGVVFTSRPLLYAKRLSGRSFALEQFDTPVKLNTGFFDTPAAFRYVDGRNSFYLVDNRRIIHGVLRCETPQKHSILDRCSHRHVRELVNKMPGRPWAAFVGLHNDLNVVVRHNGLLKWQENHWHLRDDGLLRSILIDHGCSEEVSSDLATSIYTLSELRMGSVILIPDSEDACPKVVGMIDDSVVGKELRSRFAAVRIREAIDGHFAIGILSSDGLTKVAKDGRILGCGEIVALDASQKLEGGGRSQAAKGASAFGLAVKVSEDGPITLFRAGRLLLALR